MTLKITKSQQLTDTALELFYQHGVHSIGINEILKTSGIAKKTLYSHFASKEALVLAALKERNQRYLNWLQYEIGEVQHRQALYSALADALEKWFSGQSVLGAFRGCFFINTSAEFEDPNSDISKYCASHKQQVRQLIGQYITDQPAWLLDAICILKEGAITQAYVQNDGVKAARLFYQLLMQLDKQGAINQSQSID